MEWLKGYWAYLLVAAILLAIVYMMRRLAAANEFPYRARGQLLTAGELRFYRLLYSLVKDQYAIFAMVRLADLIEVDKDSPKRGEHQGKINSKHVDFVLCDLDNLQPKLAIELDDKSHESPDRQARDIFVNQVFEAAGIPLVRVPVQASYKAEEIKKAIFERLG